MTTTRTTRKNYGPFRTIRRERRAQTRLRGGKLWATIACEQQIGTTPLGRPYVTRRQWWIKLDESPCAMGPWRAQEPDLDLVTGPGAPDLDAVLGVVHVVLGAVALAAAPLACRTGPDPATVDPEVQLEVAEGALGDDRDGLGVAGRDVEGVDAEVRRVPPVERHRVVGVDGGFAPR